MVSKRKKRKIAAGWGVHFEWKILGYVAAIFNPIPTGFLAGYCLYRDRHIQCKRTGINVIVISTFLTMILILSIIKLFR
jgi:hypothetical protein